MASGSTSKIRLVRCPKCRQILPELPEVPVYECGGCGARLLGGTARLLAKIRKNNAGSTSSTSHESDAALASNSGHVSEDKEPCSSTNDALLQSPEKCSSNQNKSEGNTLSGNCNSEQLSCLDLDGQGHNNGDDQNGSGEVHGEQQESVAVPNEVQAGQIDESENGECRNRGQVSDIKLSEKDQNERDDQGKSSANDGEQPGNIDEACSSNGTAHLKIGVPPIAGENSDVELNDESSVSVGANTEVDCKGVSDKKSRKSDTDNEIVAEEGNSSVVTSPRPAVESISAHALVSSPPVQQEHTQEPVTHSFKHTKLTDTIETTDPIGPSSELSGTLIDLSKSPTTRSARAYYEGGVSSNEGTDDQLPEQYRYFSKHTYKHANRNYPDDSPRRESLLGNRNSGIQHQLRNHASTGTQEKHFSAESSRLRRDGLHDPAGVHQPVRRWTRPEMDESRLHVPLPYGDGYQRVNPSYTLHDDFQRSTCFHPSVELNDAYPEQEKLNPSRMAYGWQDNYNNYHLKERANWWTSEEYFQNFNHPMYFARLQDQRNWHQRTRYSRIPFSAEAINNRNQYDHSLCCCGPEFRYSAQMPSHGLPHGKGFCKVHSRVNFYGSWGSCPSSPQRPLDSEFIHGTKSDDQRHKDLEAKKYARGKHRFSKRHVRPVAGGAPFITCYRCSKPLQIPEDFLLFKRKYHSLRCGACYEVLRYSLVGKMHLVPYFPAANAPPPSEVDEYSEAADRRNLASTSHAGEFPVSCSDCGLSFCPSCSTDKDPLSQSSFHAVHGSAVDRNAWQDSREYNDKGKKVIAAESRDKHKQPLETYQPSSSTSGSKILSSEIEELPRRGGSPLHRLMGYSSARALMYGFGPSSSGASSSSRIRPEVE